MPSPSWPPSDPATILACTVWMEARGDGWEGMEAVANVVLNRARNPRWWGHDIASVCLMPEQFSSWNEGSTQIPLVISAMEEDSLSYKGAVLAVELVMSGKLVDHTQNADSYYAISEKEEPTWATPETFTVQIGSQKFYRTELPPLVA
jgi:cell wall hydrolase